jgi:hypothetical protein
MAKLLSLKPGKYREEEQNIPVDPAEEESRALYWCLVILDKSVPLHSPSVPFRSGNLVFTDHPNPRITHEECPTLWSSLQMDMPADDDLLPTETIIWNDNTGSCGKSVARYPSSASASTPLGPFQRMAQAAILLGYAIQWELYNTESGLEPSVVSFVELECAARRIVEAIIIQSDNYTDNLNAYATCARYVQPSTCL